MASATYTQEGRQCKVFTNLGPDVLLLVGLEGHEALSEPFQFQLDLVADKHRQVPFEDLMGQEAHVELTLHHGARHFHGIVSQFSEGDTDDAFTHYQAMLVPAFWRLTKQFRFRIFQQQSVLEILKQVLAGLDVSLRTVETYRSRNFTVQYHETDFAFASRLMEQAGIFYWFEHRGDGHTLVLADQSASGPACGTIPFNPVVAEPAAKGPRVTAWRKTQELCSGKFTCWDYNFQMPEKRLDASCKIAEQTTAGAVTHHLNAGNAAHLEVFHFSGGYGAQFDGIDPMGAEQPPALEHLFDENKKFARLGMEREASQALRIDGAGTCHQFLPGRHFTLAGHKKASGDYLLTRVVHRLRQGGFHSGESSTVTYANEFVALPRDLSFRPACVTPWPQAQGFQPAVVVGPKDEEIFTDKYGRVKVQFLWDRDGKHDGLSSCWIRVAQRHAGRGFGMVSIPRVGQEVIVGFAGHNPDRPLIVGSVYNDRNRPPFALPEHRSRTALKSHVPHGDGERFSGLVLEDQPGQEQLQLHAERDSAMTTGRDHSHYVNRHHSLNVGGMHLVSVGAAGASGPGPADTTESDGSWGRTVGPLPWGAGYNASSPKALAASATPATPPPPPDRQEREQKARSQHEHGLHLSLTFGLSAAAASGIDATLNVGPKWSACIPPGGGLGEAGANLAGRGWGKLGGTMLAVGAFLGGNFNLNLATLTWATYGATLDFRRGPTVTMTGKVHGVTRILCAMERGLAVASMRLLSKWTADPQNDNLRDATIAAGSAGALVMFLIGVSELICKKKNHLEAVVTADTGNRKSMQPWIYPKKEKEEKKEDGDIAADGSEVVEDPAGEEKEEKKEDGDIGADDSGAEDEPVDEEKEEDGSGADDSGAVDVAVDEEKGGPPSGPPGALGNRKQVSQEVASKFFTKFATDPKLVWGYSQDGCFARTHLMVNELVGEGCKPLKVWAYGARGTNFYARPRSGGLVTWGYHVAPALNVSGSGWQVFDPALFDKPVSVNEWVRELRASKLQWTLGWREPGRPFLDGKGTGYWGGDDPDVGPDKHAVETLEAAAQLLKEAIR